MAYVILTGIQNRGCTQQKTLAECLNLSGSTPHCFSSSWNAIPVVCKAGFLFSILNSHLRLLLSPKGLPPPLKGAHHPSCHSVLSSLHLGLPSEFTFLVLSNMLMIITIVSSARLGIMSFLRPFLSPIPNPEQTCHTWYMTAGGEDRYYIARI